MHLKTSELTKYTAKYIACMFDKVSIVCLFFNQGYNVISVCSDWNWDYFYGDKEQNSIFCLSQSHVSRHLSDSRSAEVQAVAKIGLLKKCSIFALKARVVRA